MKTSPSSGRTRTRLRSLVATWSVVALAVTGVSLGGASLAQADTAPADPSDPATPVTVSADGLPSPQIDGVIWSMAMVGDLVYVGGEFTTARPAGSQPGQNTVARSNMMAFDVTTGVMTDFAPTFDGQILSVAVSPDQRRIYVAGEFRSVNDQPRDRVAAFDAATGALLPFAPPMNYHVHAVVATNSTVFVGGNFSGVGSVDRGRLAAFDVASGELLDWAPEATGGVVDSMTVNPEGTKVVVGGGFTELNGSDDPGYGLGMLDAVTGASLPFETNQWVRNGTDAGAIHTLATDGTYVYGGGWTYGKEGGTWEGVFAASWDAGKVHWLNDCHGDTYGVFPIGDVIYVANHAHYCENIDGVRQDDGRVGSYPYYRAIAFGREPTGTASWEPDQGRYYSFEGQPTSAQLGWYPSINAGSYTGQNQGPWAVTGNTDYVVMGGEFTRVNGTSQQGLTRFTVSDNAPNDQGPYLFDETYPLNVRSTAAGEVRISWSTNQDIDNEYLEYRLYRDEVAGANRIHTRQVEARFWNPFTMGHTDTGLVPGSTHRYRVQVLDPFGNVANSPWTEVTVASTGTDSDYVTAVYEDEPTDYWRMDEISERTIEDYAERIVEDNVGFHLLAASAGATDGIDGAIAGDDDGSVTFDGTSTGYATTRTTDNPPDLFSVEAWFRTTTGTGGRIIGWANNSDRRPKHDRQLYMDDAGHIHFGVKPNENREVVSSPGTYNDGTWHHVVGTLSKAGMTLYLDGVAVGSRADVTVGEHLSRGYWRLGGFTVDGWPSAPTSAYFDGDIDEVAIYKTELSAARVAVHHEAGAGDEPPNTVPTAAFTTATEGLRVTVDGTGSSDPDGTIASYAWTFGDGDGATATGPTAGHTYATAGTYGVTLTVKDDDGGTRRLTKEVTVPEPVEVPNQAPTAAFDVDADELTVSVDASTSSDPDGSIASYAWAFGDGNTATGRTAEHTYTAAGTHGITLTVVDDEGARKTLTKQVTVTAPSPEPEPEPEPEPTRPTEPTYGFFLNDAWTTRANHVFMYGRPADAVLIGDWDGDGTDSITVRRGNVFYVNNAPRGGAAESVFVYGRPGDTVLVGDWDGDGVDTLAVRRGAQYHVKNDLSSGPADQVVAYGRSGDQVVVGDWNNDGKDTFAVRRGAQYFVKNSIAPGNADQVVVYGRADDITLAGDWDGDGKDTFAVRRGATYYVKNSIAPGNADIELRYGRATDEVYVGDWNGDGRDTLGIRRLP
ncbi:PKD domain-containing protein [Georgenia subflava]|uniref:PKD domain-containing protein n=1 Tax=Georgenia subflava TaxID=1622177 RepID=A0A6N7EDT1_9MICO|nr:PKD domain-containing protein [Georgenia subflava]MPV36572.1 PKD domain-containing protein [Georgenia subflava]